MPETRVTVGRVGARQEWAFPIQVNGPGASFRIATERIEARLVAPLDDLLLDLLDIAGVIFCADSTATRGGAIRSKFGEGWRRSLAFNIPVRRPEVWLRPEVGEALTEAIRFLTDDEVDFTFHGETWNTHAETYLDFGSDGTSALQIDEVILFSGGLDSLAGTIETLATTNKRVALVSHESAPKIIAHQRDLVGKLKEKFPGRILHITVKAHRVGVEARETTQRSRSFLFAALAHVVARTVGAPRILFFENGVVSHNLPISDQVVGTMATRTTHPRSLHLVARFLDSLGGSSIPIVNRYAWLTKTEVVQKIAAHGGASMIRYAVSCTAVRGQSVLFTHCGACSQCLDRRFAVLAAGLEAEDPADQYTIDILVGARDSDHDRIIALDWASHALRLAQLQFSEFATTHIAELTRIVSGYPETPAIDVARRVHDLHQRQGNIVIAVLEHAVETTAQMLVRHSLPETSLLRLILGRQPDLARPMQPTAAVDHSLHRPAPPASESNAAPALFPLQVAFYMDGKDHVIAVKNLGIVRGRPASVAHVLRDTYEADRAQGLSRERHSFVPIGLINLPDRTSTDALIRQLIKRCRSELGDFYRAVEGCPPLKPLLIENRRQKGYRLDPDCRIIARNQFD